MWVEVEPGSHKTETEVLIRGKQKHRLYIKDECMVCCDRHQHLSRRSNFSINKEPGHKNGKPLVFVLFQVGIADTKITTA